MGGCARVGGVEEAEAAVGGVEPDDVGAELRVVGVVRQRLVVVRVAAHEQPRLAARGRRRVEAAAQQRPLQLAAREAGAEGGAREPLHRGGRARAVGAVKRAAVSAWGAGRSA